MKRLLSFTLMSGILVLGVLQAGATAQLRLDDGMGNVVTVLDNGAGDTNGATGAITYIGPVGPNWTINVTSGLTKPALGSAAQPQMDISTSNVTSQGAGMLTIEFTDTDFSGVGAAVATIGGTTPGVVNYNTYTDSGNRPFFTTTLVTQDGPLGPGAISDTKNGTIPGPAPYSLTLKTVITHNAAFQVTGFDANLGVTCACVAHNIQYNFNGTQIIFQPSKTGSIWFISDGVVKNLPNNQITTLMITNQTITIPATSSTPQFVIPVPDAVITFDPSKTTATTDFVGGVWQSTFPTSGLSGNIFYAGVAFPVPASGLPGGIKNVLWSGQFSSATSGLNISWQWSAANYSTFTTDYSDDAGGLMVKPTDDNHKSVYQNSDHAGTPEGSQAGPPNKTWKSFVVGGASGGGGSNFTGSGSSTISFPPCVCPPPD
jgi:hypothetical protein